MFFAYFAVVHRVGLFKTMKSVFCFVLWYLLEFPEHFKDSRPHVTPQPLASRTTLRFTAFNSAVC